MFVAATDTRSVGYGTTIVLGIQAEGVNRMQEHLEVSAFNPLLSKIYPVSNRNSTSTYLKASQKLRCSQDPSWKALASGKWQVAHTLELLFFKSASSHLLRARAFQAQVCSRATLPGYSEIIPGHWRDGAKAKGLG